MNRIWLFVRRYATGGRSSIDPTLPKIGGAGLVAEQAVPQTQESALWIAAATDAMIKFAVGQTLGPFSHTGATTYDRQQGHYPGRFGEVGGRGHLPTGDLPGNTNVGANVVSGAFVLNDPENRHGNSSKTQGGA